ncbi:hypothetical protein ACN6LA_000774 [Streptomyces sp. SAS_269]
MSPRTPRHRRRRGAVASGFSWKDDRFAEYRDSGPGAGTASADRPRLTDVQAADQEVADWLGDRTPASS